jgi:hypothetical protein
MEENTYKTTDKVPLKAELRRYPDSLGAQFILELMGDPTEFRRFLGANASGDGSHPILTQKQVRILKETESSMENPYRVLRNAGENSHLSMNRRRALKRIGLGMASVGLAVLGQTERKRSEGEFAEVERMGEKIKQKAASGEECRPEDLAQQERHHNNGVFHRNASVACSVIGGISISHAIWPNDGRGDVSEAEATGQNMFVNPGDLRTVLKKLDIGLQNMLVRESTNAHSRR